MQPLATSGISLVEAHTGKPILLRGVNRSGLEYSAPDGAGSLAKAGITADEIEAMVTQWGANVIRLPFNQDWALARPDYDATPYLEALDFVIQTAARAGAYTLLDLQWLDAVTPRGTLPDGSPNFVPPLPNAGSLVLWTQLAERYRDQPAVLYDIFNEPHDALVDDPLPLLGIDRGVTFPLPSKRVSMAQWQPWALHLVEAVRSRNPAALIFVPGTGWGYDLRGLPLPGVTGVVYSTHVYRNKGRNWHAAFGELAQTHPVFAGEWGGGDEDVAWGSELYRYLSARGIGWTAWSWSDAPRLVQAGTREPTAFGAIVRAALQPRSTA